MSKKDIYLVVLSWCTPNVFIVHLFQNRLKDELSCLRQFLATESPLKMTKNAFYFTSKALSFSRYLSFCLDFLVMNQNDLIKKIRLIPNFMTSQPG